MFHPNFHKGKNANDCKARRSQTGSQSISRGSLIKCDVMALSCILTLLSNFIDVACKTTVEYLPKGCHFAKSRGQHLD